jgi:hypothetical protein
VAAVGLQAPVWIMLGLALAGALVALGIRETAPGVVLTQARPVGSTVVP